MTQILSPELPVLVVDDEDHALESEERMLVSQGITNVLQCQDSRELLSLLSEQEVSVILLDLTMPHISGEQLLPGIIMTYPEVPVIIVTASNQVDTAVRCMKLGAFDYMVKPVEESRLLSGVRRAIELREVRRTSEMVREHLLSDEVKFPEAFSHIITNNPVMYGIFRYCESISKSLWPVLLTGETGVGKELFARSIYALSGRSGAFVAINAAGLDDTVFSDTLFGHARGAYTGADESRKGLIEQAAQGMLFLDEIGDLSQASQLKLLRVIEEREYYPLGSDVARKSDARIVFATNRDLDALQASGQFRKDLYHRLNTHRVHIPPLRKRLDDIPILVDHFLEMASKALQKKRPTCPKELYVLLTTYSFPGNVRELESMVFDAVANHESRMLSMAVFEARILQGAETAAVPENQAGPTSSYVLFDRLPTLKESSALLVAEALRRVNGNQTMAARLLGISRTGLNKRVHQDKDHPLSLDSNRRDTPHTCAPGDTLTIPSSPAV